MECKRCACGDEAVGDGDVCHTCLISRSNHETGNARDASDVFRDLSEIEDDWNEPA